MAATAGQFPSLFNKRADTGISKLLDPVKVNGS